MTSIVPRWWRIMGDVSRYWNRRWTGSTTRISSGIGSPASVVISRLVPSTGDDVIPGNHSYSRAASPTSCQTSSADRRIRVS